MAAGSTTRQTRAEAFTAPTEVNQRRYEALRAYYTERLTYREARATVRLRPLDDDRPGP
jgi:hypothetical protein